MNCRRCQHSLTGNSRFCPNCHEFVPESFIGQVLGGKYELLDVLGMGGMGAVYRARRQRIGDEVVVKILLPNLSQESARFHREAEAAASVKHSNVVIIHDSDEARGGAPAFIVMEMVEGAPLRRLLQSEGRLEPSRAVALMRQICAGVGAAHGLGVIHRDLKPENVMVVPPEEDGETETVKVLDFGLAKLLDQEATRVTQYGTVLGTAYYMPPEQWRGAEVDARADVYSLGVMLYEMLTGKWPFTGRTRDELMLKHLSEPPPSLPLEVDAPPELEAVIKRALAKERDARPADAKAFRRELQEAMRSPVIMPPPMVASSRRAAAMRSPVMPPPMTNSVDIEFVWIPPGSFRMGSTIGGANERPVHQVTIARGFYMGRYEMTQAHWQRVMGNNPSRFRGDNLPVERVSWDDAISFIAKLNGQNDGFTYCLPTEAEWEYACRAGTTGDYAGNLDAMAWYIANSGMETHPVGGKQPNGFGLYDMHGNVWEWCEDVWHDSYNGAPTDGSAWLSGGESNSRMLRGGSWNNIADSCRSAYRVRLASDNSYNIIGIRVVAFART